MNGDELVTKIFSLLDQLCCKVVIKDFVGFMNWDNSLGTALLPYTGHHSAFCSAVKQDPRAFAKCVRCSRVHQHYCIRRQQPFTVPCFLGLSEYSVPIMIDGLCIGSISAGLWHTDPDASRLKLRSLIAEFEMDGALLLQLFDELPDQAPFPRENCRIIDFFAVLLGEIFRPFVCHIQSSVGKMHPLDKGINTIMTYIRNNYTDPTINVATIASACNYSPSYVSHTFSRYMKMNLRTYINQMRIILAKHELQNGNSVFMTAMVCGYSDANYFTTVFRRVVGVSASQYARTAAHREKPVLPANWPESPGSEKEMVGSP